MKSETGQPARQVIKSGGKRGMLYIVATPIGNLEDLSPRAVKVLSSVAVIAAEDTRHSGRLLEHLGISKPMIALHDHNERDRVQNILGQLLDGADVALISDAGTPLISDPGYVLVREARAAGVQVSPIPGPCALVAALSAAGLPTDRFLFVGFLPAKRAGRRAVLDELRKEVATLVFYESPHRILSTVLDISEVMGVQREVVLGREITKTFETFYSGEAADVHAALTEDPHGSRGEFVVMVKGAEKAEAGLMSGELDVDHLLGLLMAELPLKKAAKIASGVSGLSKNELYQRALELKDSEG